MPPDTAAPPPPFDADDAVVRTVDLRKTYRDGFLGRNRVHALRGVSLEVRRGEIFGLLGPNGAGKTTLIKLLLGIARKSDGEATVLGHPAGARAARRRVGYLPESHRIPRHLTANTALEYYGQLSGLPLSEVKRKRPELLELVGLAKWGSTGVKKFSKGMQQRLGLAQAMLHDPDLLVLDEPTDGVDPVGRADIRRVLGVLKDRGKTVFLNSHLLQELELVCDRAAILRDGRVRRVGSMDEFRGAGEAATEVVLRLLGSRDACRDALAGRDVRAVSETALETFELRVGVEGQPEVDAVVDQVRAAGLSLHSLTRQQLTLEQAFLKIVEEDEADGPESGPADPFSEHRRPTQAGGVTE